MTVNPGFGGQAYIPTMTDKIRKIRKWIVDRELDVDIEVDGGIKASPETIGACAQAGANCFIAGSGLFAYGDAGHPFLRYDAFLFDGFGTLHDNARAAGRGGGDPGLD
ncbi:ribulose-phosphate 3-epimerase [Aureococcus anophagefferens]|nr:ribulose-phosphate 3-epimerase [Aureococcus anophagefferens]